jgi:glycosyltransferase A (GT-A) superfamily protein (DUF2064 family)
VLLFARAPRREARAKGLDRAEDLFALLGRCVARAAAGIADLVVVGPADPSLPGAAARLDQRGAGFGERLENAFADARALGYTEVVAVPGDVPGLGARHLLAAFAALGSHAVALGPSPDGGVYLIGLGLPPGALFDGVRWRTRHALADLRARAGGAALLSPLGDLDREADLEHLAREPGLDPVVARELLVLVRRPRHSRPSHHRPPFLVETAPFAGRGPPALG